MQIQTRTVQVKNVSDLATEREVREFFSFSGEIEHIEILRESGQPKTAFVTFKDPKALEIALLLTAIPTTPEGRLEPETSWGPSALTRFPEWLLVLGILCYAYGATLVDRIVTITAVENYLPRHEMEEVRTVDNAICVAPAENGYPYVEANTSSTGGGRIYVSRAQEVVTNVLAKSSAIRQDAVNKAKAFDEKHQLTANASAKVVSFDKKVGLTEKLTVGISVVNEKVKSVDQRLHVSDKTMAAILAAERKINDTGSAVKTSRYVTAGTAWLNGAFSKVAKVGQVAGSKTREKFHLAMSNLTAKDPSIVA